MLVAFVAAWGYRGAWFAWSIAILLGMNQCFVWLVQQNRFYTMATLFLVLALVATWSRVERYWMSIGVCMR